jgi:hypothetical protein
MAFRFTRDLQIPVQVTYVLAEHANTTAYVFPFRLLASGHLQLLFSVTYNNRFSSYAFRPLCICKPAALFSL